MERTNEKIHLKIIVMKNSTLINCEDTTGKQHMCLIPDYFRTFWGKSFFFKVTLIENNYKKVNVNLIQITGQQLKWLVMLKWQFLIRLTFLVVFNQVIFKKKKKTFVSVYSSMVL